MAEHPVVGYGGHAPRHPSKRSVVFSLPVVLALLLLLLVVGLFVIT